MAPDPCSPVDTARPPLREHRIAWAGKIVDATDGLNLSPAGYRAWSRALISILEQ